MIDLSNVIAIALGSDDVLQIQDAIGTVLWQKTIYYTVNISAGSNGTVSVNGVSGNYSQSVPSGTVLTIEGTGNTGYNFDEWSDGNTTNPRTITVTGDLTLTASFESAVRYCNVSISAGNNGTVSVNGVSGDYSQSVVYGSTLTIEGVGDTGYDFDGWSDGNSLNPRFITVYSDITLTAAFTNLENSYFFIENRSGATETVTIKKTNNSATTITVYNSTDGTNWSTMGNTSTTGITATLYNNQKMYLKATTTGWGDTSYYNIIQVSDRFNVGGNIMSLLYGDNFQGQTTVSSNCFRTLFGGTTYLINAYKLKLPATTLGSYCYLGMFNNCSGLITAPTILPATTLATFCYSTMFKNCTALTTAPVLPATTLLQSSYASLFNGCSSLNSVTSYAQDISAASCLNNWLANVAPTGTFYNNGTAVYTVDSPSGIPQGWTEVKPNYFYVEDVSGADNTLSITKNHADAPTVEVFYSTDKMNWTSMGSTSTTPVTATVPANGKLYLKATADAWGGGKYNSINLTGNYNVGGNVMSLLYGDNHANKVTFPNNSSFNFSGLFYASITLVDASNLILPATTLAEHCYNSMFYYCTGLTTAPTLPATTLAQNCYYGMFYSCTALTTAPVLPASTLAAGCYGAMFYGCFNLNNVTTYADDISAGGCLNQWLGAVSATGDLYNLGTATYATDSPSGIPTGWTEHNSL